ncbi:Microcin C7 resistance MccF family protein [Spiroplasma clarkii]|uniref:S66 family peptidase n=1 Tax=Spiroplasma clarkii TaxID=2139 RepID=UPI000B551837|nr:S66 peptidase family protein [Spiroplasma clarkii]ARU90984.1 Microcin C7 resistance MccF family protein [Spiroplasma clarkii]
MKKPASLKSNDVVAIVSLSSGILGEPFCTHSLALGIKRLEEFGLKPKFMPNSLKGVDFLDQNPEARATDLKTAFSDPEVKAIICAIGGEDTYRILPYLMEDAEFKNLVKSNPKIFIGYSDSTINHLMFQSLGLTTFYGHAFLVDFAELDQAMLPYSRQSFEMMFTNQAVQEIKSSPVWYEERKTYGVENLNRPRVSHQETHGFLTLRGTGMRTGKLWGGCLESIYEALVGERYPEQKEVCQKYELFKTNFTTKDLIVFLETSEEQPTPAKYQVMLQTLIDNQLLANAQALIMGKPQDESYFTQYQEILVALTKDLQIPVLYNINFGHAHPKTILPYGVTAQVDFDKKV